MLGLFVILLAFLLYLHFHLFKKVYLLSPDYEIVSKINKKIYFKVKSYKLNALSLNEIDESEESSNSETFSIKNVIITYVIPFIMTITSSVIAKNF